MNLNFAMNARRSAPLTLAAAIMTASLAGNVHAAPPGFQDARALGMGGTGVASARPAGAALFNPALLAAEHDKWSDDFALTLPSVNARFADNDDVVDEIDAIQDALEGFEEAVRAFDEARQNNNPDGAQEAVEDVQQSSEDLARALTGLDQETMRFGFGAGTLVAVPGRNLAVGVHANAQLRATVKANMDDDDIGAFEAVAEAEDVDGVETELDAIYDFDNEELRALGSEGEILASAVGEFGVSFARPFMIEDHEVLIGVTPKYVQMRTFDYRQGVDDFDDDDFDASDFETRDNHLNLDLGVTTQVGPERQWRLGASVRNLIPRSLKTVGDENGEDRQELNLDPKVTVGVAHTSDWHTLAADLDLTKTDSIGPDADQQFLSLGGELNLVHWVNVRGGLRHNLASDTGASGIEEKTQFTAGLALTPLAMRIETAALYSSEEIGAAVELGISF